MARKGPVLFVRIVHEEGAAIAMVDAVLGSSSSCPLPQERSFELSALMDLRLAFGPGTRLWALRSREELCSTTGSTSRRARRNASSSAISPSKLDAHERENALEGMSMREIRKRIAVVLRAYRIRKRKRPSALVAVGHRPEPAQVKVLNGTHRASVSGAEILIPAISIHNTADLSLNQGKQAH